MSFDENDFFLIFKFQTTLFFITRVMIFLNVSTLSKFKNEIELFFRYINLKSNFQHRQINSSSFHIINKKKKSR